MEKFASEEGGFGGFISTKPQYIIIPSEDGETQLKVRLNEFSMDNFAKAMQEIMGIPEAREVFEKYGLEITKE